MDDNERAAIRELQEQTRGEEGGSAGFSPTSVAVFQAVRNVLLGALVLVLMVVLYSAATDPCFEFRRDVAFHGDVASAVKIWSLDCEKKNGRCVCSNGDPGFGCNEHCTAQEGELSVNCGVLCSDPVAW